MADKEQLVRLYLSNPRLSEDALREAAPGAELALDDFPVELPEQDGSLAEVLAEYVAAAVPDALQALDGSLVGAAPAAHAVAVVAAGAILDEALPEQGEFPDALLAAHVAAAPVAGEFPDAVEEHGFPDEPFASVPDAEASGQDDFPDVADCSGDLALPDERIRG